MKRIAVIGAGNTGKLHVSLKNYFDSVSDEQRKEDAAMFRDEPIIQHFLIEEVQDQIKTINLVSKQNLNNNKNLSKRAIRRKQQREAKKRDKSN